MTRPAIHTSYNGSCLFNDNGSVSIITSPAVSHDEVCTGVSRRKPTGWIPPTPYSVTADHISKHRGQYGYGESLSNYRRSFAGHLDASGITGTLNACDEVVELSTVLLELSGLGNASLITALSNLKSKKIDLGVAWAERKQTASLVADTATRISGALWFLFEGKPRKAMNALGISRGKPQPKAKKAAGKWLELQYGWKPLLSDVYGAAEALAGQPPSNWRVTARGTKKFDKDWSYQGSQPGWPTPAIFGSCKASYGAFTRIDAMPTNEALISLSSLGVTNPLLVAWERVPFSFVADWFLPVGNWLNTLDAMLGYTDIWTSTSIRCKADWSVSGKGYSLPSTRYVTASYSGARKYASLTRSVSNGLVIPRIPRVKNPASLLHMSNAIALLGQVFRRR